MDRKHFSLSTVHRAMQKRLILFTFVLVATLLAACGTSGDNSATRTTTTQPTLSPTAAPVPAATPTLVLTPTSPPPTPSPTKPPATPTVAPVTVAPPILDLRPASMSLVGHLDCQKTSVYICLARVIARASNQVNLPWHAFTNVPGMISFSPTSGMLAPGQSVLVTIRVPLNACTQGLFFFQGPANTHTITWAC